VDIIGLLSELGGNLEGVKGALAFTEPSCNYCI